MAEEKRPSGRTLEEEIRFTSIALKMTEKYAGEEWAETQADRLTIELAKLEAELKQREKAKTLTNKQKVARSKKAVERLNDFSYLEKRRSKKKGKA